MKIKQFICYLGCLLTLASCRVFDKLPENELLYAGATVTIQNDSSFQKKELVKLTESLTELTRPLPNNRIFGFPYKVAFHYLLSTDKQKGIKAKFQKRLGEKPVFITQSMIDRNVLILENQLATEGHFRSKVTGELVQKNKKNALASYKVWVSPQYNLTSVSFATDSTAHLLATEFVDSFKDVGVTTKLAAQQPYNFEAIKTERQRLDNLMRNNGYYYFRPDFVDIKADTSIGNKNVKLHFQPKYNTPAKAQRQYLVNDIYIFTTATTADSVDNEADFFRGIILDSTKNYKQRVFTDAIGFRPGNYYSSDKHDITMSRLVNLNNFKFVKNRFEVVNRLDSSLLNIYYYLTPQKKKSLRADLSAVTRSSGVAGSQLSLSWLNRNLFKGAEMLTIAANISSEVQLGGKTLNSTYRNNYRLALTGTLDFPRFLFPYLKIDPENSKILPKTSINLGSETIIKKGLYQQNLIKSELKYVWRKGIAKEFEVKPIKIFRVKSDVTNEFTYEVFKNPGLLSIIEDQFILSSSVSFLYSPALKNRTKSNLSTTIDFAGTFVGLVDKFRADDSEKKGEFLGEKFAQFVRTEIDYKNYFNVSQKTTWVNRGMVGVGIPYGNSFFLPTFQQFWSGGNSGIRAFLARGVGPGSYAREGTSQEQFFGLFTGDIKLELNTEVRTKLTDIFEGALFIDAGNVWMFKDPFIYNENALFSKNFYKELAVGGGVGLRLDLSFFVFRLDLATPLRKPWLEEGNRWVINDFNFGNKTWRQENLILNIAVGYPF